jgi:hypothetical protein
MVKLFSTNRNRISQSATLALATVAALFLTGCATAKPLKPGHAKHTTSERGPSTVELHQPENPAQPAKQDFEKTSEKTTHLPAGTTVKEITVTPQANTNLPPIRTERVFTLPADMTETVKQGERSATTIGASQKDTAREIGAKLSALRPVQILGGLLILAALAMFHPAVKAVTLSTTLQAVTGGVGMGLIFLPTIIVGHEGILLAAGIAVPAVWFFAHRHGQLRGPPTNVAADVSRR